MAMHTCPARGCTAQVPRHKLMCLTHWRMVPPIIQGAVYWAYDHHDDMEHRRAVADAIEAVNAQMAPGGVTC